MKQSRVVIGQKYGRLTVERSSGSNKFFHRLFVCRCACGQTTTVMAANLLRGSTRSCGCFQRDTAKIHGGSNRKPKGECCFNWLYYRYKYQAKRRSIVFSLDKENFRLITSSTCAYCGHPPSMQAKSFRDDKPFNGNYVYNSVDRVDSCQGYTLENVVSACKICQFAKRDMSTEEFKTWVVRAHAHLPNWP